jgi:hypothetical protein
MSTEKQLSNGQPLPVKIRLFEERGATLYDVLIIMYFAVYDVLVIRYDKLVHDMLVYLQMRRNVHTYG